MRRAAHLPQPPPEVPVTCGHDVAAVLAHALADAVVRVGAAMHAGQALHPGVLHGGAPSQVACSVTARSIIRFLECRRLQISYAQKFRLLGRDAGWAPPREQVCCCSKVAGFPRRTLLFRARRSTDTLGKELRTACWFCTQSLSLSKRLSVIYIGRYTVTAGRHPESHRVLTCPTSRAIRQL